MKRNKMWILVAKILLFMVVWSAEPISESGAIFTSLATAEEPQPLAKIANLVLTRAKMGDLNPALCKELGLGNGRDRCPFRQVSLRIGDVLDVFDAIQDPVTRHIDIVLFHQIIGEDGHVAEAYLYWTSPDGELRKTLYGKRYGRRKLLSGLSGIYKSGVFLGQSGTGNTQKALTRTSTSLKNK
jgi:hypothetical protein